MKNLSKKILFISSTLALVICVSSVLSLGVSAQQSQATIDAANNTVDSAANGTAFPLPGSVNDTGQIQTNPVTGTVDLSPTTGTNALGAGNQNNTNALGAGNQNNNSTNCGQSTQGTFTLCNPLGNDITISSIILKFMEIVTYLAVLFAVLMLMWTGLQYVLARGNKDRITELSKQLLAIVIGVAIILGARILISAVIGTLKATGTVNTQIIDKASNAIQGI